MIYFLLLFSLHYFLIYFFFTRRTHRHTFTNTLIYASLTYMNNEWKKDNSFTLLTLLLGTEWTNEGEVESAIFFYKDLNIEKSKCIFIDFLLHITIFMHLKSFQFFFLNLPIITFNKFCILNIFKLMLLLLLRLQQLTQKLNSM